MEEKLFSLMHRDDPVCAITIDAASGADRPRNQGCHREAGLLPAGMARLPQRKAAFYRGQCSWIWQEE